MSRHNRRRTRPNNHNPIRHPSSAHAPLHLPSGEPPPILYGPPRSRISTRGNDIIAKHWQNRYLIWWSMEREPQRLAAEQIRIFGGESGESDEDGLCYRMLEFFGGLDFLR